MDSIDHIWDDGLTDLIISINSKVKYYDIPLLYYDDNEVRYDNYNVIREIRTKILGINDEIDFYMNTIMKIVAEIFANNGFREKIKYVFRLSNTVFSIYDIRHDHKKLPRQTFDVPIEYMVLLETSK